MWQGVARRPDQSRSDQINQIEPPGQTCDKSVKKKRNVHGHVEAEVDGARQAHRGKKRSAAHHEPRAKSPGPPTPSSKLLLRSDDASKLNRLRSPSFDCTLRLVARGVPPVS